ncbi:MAG: hypothetical protein R3F56_00935 [Planctomycetota bacterium]
MSNGIFQFACPCCGKRIEYDVRSHQARAVKVKDAKVSKDFDALLADQSLERKRLDSAFGQAVDAQKHEKEALEDLFRTAKKKADEDPDDAPPRPFDLD